MISLLTVLSPIAWIFSGITLAPELISASISSYHFRVKIGWLRFSSCLLNQGGMIIKHVC